MNELKPNLFIIGAMKCGTTSLHTYLGDHPDILMCPMKEPSHFVNSEELRIVWPGPSRPSFGNTEKDYCDLFRGGEGKLVRGESSTAYTKLHKVTGVAKRIYDFNSDAKLIYIMRDPIERTISHYWHAVDQ